MKKLILFSMLLCVVMMTEARASELYSPTPQCTVIRNDTKSTLMFQVRTARFANRDGTKESFTIEERLAPSKTKQVCAKGPFWPGYQVEFTIRTMFPIFTCRTRLQGEIVMKTEKDKDGTEKITALCRS